MISGSTASCLLLILVQAGVWLPHSDTGVREDLHVRWVCNSAAASNRTLRRQGFMFVRALVISGARLHRSGLSVALACLFASNRRSSQPMVQGWGRWSPRTWGLLGEAWNRPGRVTVVHVVLQVCSCGYMWCVPLFVGSASPLTYEGRPRI